MVAILTIENITLDRIVFGLEKLKDFVQSICLDDFVRDNHIVLGAKVDAILQGQILFNFSTC